ncbi:MAG: hypothetical protein M1457_11860, partial [bacterium]|nr:hypothetical protein [bacterium]
MTHPEINFTPPLAITRRRFMAAGAAGMAGAALAAGAGVAGCGRLSGVGAATFRPIALRKGDRPMLDLAALPNFCAHEHWGSIPPMMTPEDNFVADRQQGTTPSRRTGLLDLLLDPYFGGAL